MEITTEELKKKIENGEKLVVDFWANWCGPCKMLKPTFDKISEEYMSNKSEVQFYSMDVDKNREFAASLGIRAIPTIKVFNKKEIVDTKIGMMMESQLRTIADTLINE